MKTTNIISQTVIALAGFSMLLMTGCSTYRAVIEKQAVTVIPEERYERIIKLYNPEGAPDKTLAGIVFIKEGAKVCTDYPREETVKSLDDLDMLEKYAYQFFRRYAIADEGRVFGYFALPLETRALIYKNSKPEDCIYKVVIIEPERRSDINKMPDIDAHMR